MGVSHILLLFIKKCCLLLLLLFCLIFLICHCVCVPGKEKKKLNSFCPDPAQKKIAKTYWIICTLCFKYLMYKSAVQFTLPKIVVTRISMPTNLIVLMPMMGHELSGNEMNVSCFWHDYL